MVSRVEEQPPSALFAPLGEIDPHVRYVQPRNPADIEREGHENFMRAHDQEGWLKRTFEYVEKTPVAELREELQRREAVDALSEKLGVKKKTPAPPKVQAPPTENRGKKSG